MRDLVHEGVLPADDVPLWPPVRPEGVVRLGDKHIGEALRLAPRIGPEDLKLVEALQVEFDGPLRPVDLEYFVVLASRGEARSLQRADRAVLELHYSLECVVYIYFCGAATVRQG